MHDLVVLSESYSLYRRLQYYAEAAKMLLVTYWIDYECSILVLRLSHLKIIYIS